MVFILGHFVFFLWLVLTEQLFSFFCIGGCERPFFFFFMGRLPDTPMAFF